MAHYLQIGLDEALKIEQAGDAKKYADFVDKFKTKKTTDDCYTPDNIMEAVNSWVRDEYGVEPERFVRPFWPGADYERAEYPEGCVVVDNPPFSILSKITNFYTEKGIRFFSVWAGADDFGQQQRQRVLCVRGREHHLSQRRRGAHKFCDQPGRCKDAHGAGVVSAD